MTLGTANGPFDVEVGALSALSATEAVDIFHEMLVSEAISCGIPVTAASVPRAITTADGGVDAEVTTLGSARLAGGLLRAGHTRYQIKTGSFSASTTSDLKALLLQPKHLDKRKLRPEHLNPRVKACLDIGGRFVAVLFGSDAVGTKDGYGEKELKALLEKIDPAYKTATVEILRANQICAAISVVAPKVALRLNGLSGAVGAPLYGLDYMRDSCDLEVSRHIETEELDKREEAISSAANSFSGFRHIRVLGDAGAGKTHLVYRAIENSQLKNHALYCADAEPLLDSPVFAQLLRLVGTARIILIVDECDIDQATLLQARLRRKAANFLLVTIFNQFENDEALGDHVQLVEVEPLDPQAMVRIFAGYGIPPDRQQWLADLCHGSPRAAHRIGQYIQAQPELDYADQFRKLDTLWELVVCSPEGRHSEAGLKKLTVARCIALFRKVAWNGPDGPSGRLQIESVANLVDKNLSSRDVADSIRRLTQARTIQGSAIYYVSPKLLHVKLWCDWWENFGHLLTNQWLQETLNGRMKGWFFEMFEYAEESKAAKRMLEMLLSSEGPLAKLEYFSEPGNPKLFFALAQADSKAALRRLKTALEHADINVRLQFSAGRREVVHGLERLAISAENFLEATECLLLLAEAENESWSNNATGVFISMFTLGYGKLAASELPPLAKMPYLRSLLQSDSPARRQLAIQALTESLKPFTSRVQIGDMAGLRRLPERWRPRTDVELFDAYAAHVNLLADAYKFLGSTDRLNAAEGVVSSARSLLTIGVLAQRVVGLLRTFSADEEIREKVIEAVESSLHYDHDAIPSEVRSELTRLRSELTEQSLHDKLRRYVGLQLIEDSFDEEGKHREQPRSELLSLCEEVLRATAQFASELTWLVTSRAKNGFQFGFELAKADSQYMLWPLIANAWLRAEEDRSDYFVGGYLAGVFQRATAQWEQLLNGLFQTTAPSNELASLVWRSGMTDSIATELHRRCIAGELDAAVFRLFVYGGVIRSIPLPVVVDVMTRLVQSEAARDADAALDIVQARLRTTPDDTPRLLLLLESILLHRTFIHGVKEDDKPDRMRDYHWTQGAKVLLRTAPERALHVAVDCIAGFGSRGSITESFFPMAAEFLNEAAERFPSEIWLTVAARLSEEDGRGVYRLMQWLRGSNGGRADEASGFDFFPVEVVLKWVDESPEARVRIVAQSCPPTLSSKLETPTLSRLLLERYGDMEEVRGVLHSNFWSEMFSGPASEHYQRRLEVRRAMLEQESDINVKIWLREEVAQLETAIQVEREREEAEDL